jgi:CDP-diacylglycerol--glycerol-3-phosphate 3-phosphatidyltransferase
MIYCIKNLFSKKYLPLTLTLIRIIGAIVIIFPQTLWFGQSYFVGLLFFVFSITDFFDGMLARFYKTESYIGSLLDPLADKILNLSALIPFVIHGIISPVVVFFLLVRDAIVMVIREYCQNKKEQLKPNILAKIKTLLLMAALVGCYGGYNHDIVFVIIIICSYASLIQYIRDSKIYKQF